MQTQRSLGWRKLLRGFKKETDFPPRDAGWVLWFWLPNSLVGRRFTVTLLERAVEDPAAEGPRCLPRARHRIKQPGCCRPCRHPPAEHSHQIKVVFTGTVEWAPLFSQPQLLPPAGGRELARGPGWDGGSSQRLVTKTSRVSLGQAGRETRGCCRDAQSIQEDPKGAEDSSEGFSVQNHR